MGVKARLQAGEDAMGAQGAIPGFQASQQSLTSGSYSTSCPGRKNKVPSGPCGLQGPVFTLNGDPVATCGLHAMLALTEQDCKLWEGVLSQDLCSILLLFSKTPFSCLVRLHTVTGGHLGGCVPEMEPRWYPNRTSLAKFAEESGHVGP